MCALKVGSFHNEAKKTKIVVDTDWLAAYRESSMSFAVVGPTLK